MDYKYRDYFLFRCSGRNCEVECLLKALFNCKLSSPYNHFKSRSYDGENIRSYVTHMISVPKNRADEFIDFLSKRENVGEIVMKLDKGVLIQ